MMRVPQQALVASQTGLSQQNNAYCSAAQLDNKVCDEACNTLQFGFDGGFCCERSNPDCAPWNNENVLASWPYALTIGEGAGFNETTVVPMMPASFHRALREQQVAQIEADEGEVANRTELYYNLLSSLPSFACPECSTLSGYTHRSIPLTVPGEPPQQMFKQLDEDSTNVGSTPKGSFERAP